MYDDILVPTDGGIDASLDHALGLAADYGATLHGLYIVDKRLYLAAEEEQEEIVDKLEEEGESALATLTERAEERGVAVTTTSRHGVPYRDLLGYVEDRDIDLVVMGTHGRTGRDRLTNLGSTTERVVRASEAPVLTVRIDGEREA